MSPAWLLEGRLQSHVLKQERRLFLVDANIFMSTPRTYCLKLSVDCCYWCLASFYYIQCPLVNARRALLEPLNDTSSGHTGCQNQRLRDMERSCQRACSNGMVSEMSFQIVFVGYKSVGHRHGSLNVWYGVFWVLPVLPVLLVGAPGPPGSPGPPDAPGPPRSSRSSRSSHRPGRFVA